MEQGSMQVSTLLTQWYICGKLFYLIICEIVHNQIELVANVERIL